MHPDSRHILTDEYSHEKIAGNNGTAPIRWIDFQGCPEMTLLSIYNSPEFIGPMLASIVDLHPASDPTFRRIALKACPNDTRRVYVDNSVMLHDQDNRRI